MLLLIILAGATAGYFMKFDIVYQNQAGNNILKGFISDFGGETGIGIFTLILGLFGLIILLATLVKAFLVDLRQLSTIHYILSLIALGLALLFVSYIYTKNRDKIKKLM